MAKQNRTNLKNDIDANLADGDRNAASDVRGELKDMIDSLAALENTNTFSQQQQFNSGLDTRDDVVDDQGRTWIDYNKGKVPDDRIPTDARDFGVVAGSSSPSTASSNSSALQSRIDTLSNDGGGLLNVYGDVYIDSKIVVKNGVRFNVHGVLRPIGDHDIVEIEQGSIVRNLAIDTTNLANYQPPNAALQINGSSFSNARKKTSVLGVRMKGLSNKFSNVTASEAGTGVLLEADNGNSITWLELEAHISGFGRSMDVDVPSGFINGNRFFLSFQATMESAFRVIQGTFDLNNFYGFQCGASDHTLGPAIEMLSGTGNKFYSGHIWDWGQVEQNRDEPAIYLGPNTEFNELLVSAGESDKFSTGNTQGKRIQDQGDRNIIEDIFNPLGYEKTGAYINDVGSPAGGGNENPETTIAGEVHDILLDADVNSLVNITGDNADVNTLDNIFDGRPSEGKPKYTSAAQFTIDFSSVKGAYGWKSDLLYIVFLYKEVPSSLKVELYSNDTDQFETISDRNIQTEKKRRFTYNMRANLNKRRPEQIRITLGTPINTHTGIKSVRLFGGSDFTGGYVRRGGGGRSEMYRRLKAPGLTDPNGNDVVGSQVTDSDLSNTPNTGDQATDDLINALVNVITTHGLGST